MGAASALSRDGGWYCRGEMVEMVSVRTGGAGSEFDKTGLLLATYPHRL